jgi:hypothetical protein
MTGELNKILGRDFIIGFFLPALFFSVATFFLAKLVWPTASWLEINWRKPLEDAGVFLLATWILGIFWQSINREIFRTAEGYWWCGLRSRLDRWQRRKFNKLKSDYDDLYGRIHTLDAASLEKLTQLSRLRARKFPSEEAQVLPTSFGNVVRAYEDYSRVVYAFESIQGWARLQGLLSKDFRQSLGSDRARVDLWLNLCFLSAIAAVEVLAVAIATKYLLACLLPVIFAIAWVAYLRARASVEQFGEGVKAAFDLYLPGLATTLGYQLSSNPAKNRKFWTSFGQVMVHRDAGALEEMLKSGLDPVRIPLKKEEAQ